MKKIAESLNSLKVRASIAFMMASVGCPMMNAYAVEITEAGVTSFLGQAIDIVFALMAAGVAVMGAFQLIPGIIHFVQASQSGNGDQRKEAGNGIAAAVVLLLLAGSLFMLKTPVKSFLGAGA